MKKKAKIITLFLCCVMLVGVFAACAKQPAEPEVNEPQEPTEGATMVMRGGTIYTLDENDTVATAIAIDGGTITYIGDDAGVEEYIGDNTEVIELMGQTVTPGFIDGHTHEVQNIIARDSSVYLNETAADLELYKAAVISFMEANPDAEVIYGSGMDLNAFPNTQPTNDWLNELCPDVPVVLTDMSLHGKLANDKALEICGITVDTQPPAGGTIYAEGGKLTGYLSDAGSLLSALPTVEYTKEQYRAAFLEFQEECNSYGITGIDIAGPTIDGPDAWEVFNQMEQAGELNLRINCSTWARGDFGAEIAQQAVAQLEAGQKYNSDFQHINQVKGIIDGVPEGKTASLIDPYAPEAGEAADYKGVQFATQQEMDEFVAVIDKAGYQVQIHAMGDAGINTVLNSYEKAQQANGERDSRHKIAHVTLLADGDAERMGALKVIGAMQPLWWYYDPFFSPLEEQMFGAERFAKEYPIRSMMDQGIVITGSIDYPVLLDMRPLYGMEAGVTQCSPYPGEEDDSTYLRNADQTVSALEMLKVYTTNGAYGMFMDDIIGSLKVGKKADMVVLSQDILKIDAKKISDTEIVKTISDGRIVFEA